MPALNVLPNWRARVADALVLWPERARDGRVDFADPDAAGAAARADLTERLAAAYPHVPREDTGAAIDAFDLKANGGFLTWMDCLVAALDLGPDIVTDGEVARSVVLARNWRSWLAASARYDLDCILTYRLAKLGRRPSDYNAAPWGATCELSSHDLAAVLGRGVADMHVHLGGLRHPNWLWLRSIAFGLDPLELPGFYRLLDRAPAKKALILRFAGDNRKTSPIVERLLLSLGDADDVMRAPQKLFDAERRVLIETWRRALDEVAQSDDLRHIDRYFNAKCAFLSIVAQPAHGSRPGLQEFRMHFAASRPKWPRDRTLARGTRDRQSMLSLVATDLRLKRLELRTAPLPTMGDYEKLLSAPLPRGTRFCVHFMRSMDEYRGKPAADSWRRFHTDLARKAATLHGYRAALADLDEACRNRLALLPRIDVAGEERDNPPENFAYIFRLLRGDDKAWNLLREKKPDCEIYEPWFTLLGGGADPRVQPLARLNASCHAGEDYFHPLDGLAAIDCAVEGLQLADGDSLGHALALGAFAADGSALRGAQCFAPTGRQFDVLLWLHSIARSRDAPASEITALDEALCELGDAIKLQRPAGGWLALHPLLEAQRGPVLQDPGESPGQLAFYNQHADSKVADARMNQREILPVFDKLRRVAIAARRTVADKIAARGVLIEINPSSNLRIGGVDTSFIGHGTFRDGDILRLPLLNLIRDFHTTIRFTINTDDPGVFVTSIASEFALLFECLLEDRWTRRDAIDFLDRCRIAGLEGLR